MRLILTLLAALLIATSVAAAPHPACKLGDVTLAIARVPGGEPMRVTDAALLEAVTLWSQAERVQGGANFAALPRYVYVTLFRGEDAFAGLIRVHDEGDRLRIWVRVGDKLPTLCTSGTIDRAQVDAWVSAVQEAH